MDQIRRRPDKLVDTSYHPNVSPPKSSEQATKPSTACDYKNDLLIAIVPLLLVLLTFGGKFSILVMCFGGLVCYIFDLVGSVEGTIASLIVTMFCEVACLVWAARTFISESIYNFSVILLMWIVLLYAFLISCNFFSGIVHDVGMVLAVTNQLMFATLPLVSAPLLSWFLCIEIPSLDLLLCFNAIYFLYVLWLGRPRTVNVGAKKSSGKGSPTSSTAPTTRLLLPSYVLIIVYIIPILMTIFMHIAIHHNVLSTHHTRVTNFLLSVIVPALLMTYCAHKQLASSSHEFHANDDFIVNSLPKFLQMSAYGLICALIYCLQSHPLFDELKSFSSMNETFAGACIMGAIFLIFAAFVIHNFSKQQMKAIIEQSEHVNLTAATASARLQIKVISMLASLCIGGANALVCAVIGLPHHAVGVSIVGAMALCEYYIHPEWSYTNKVILLCIASIYSALAAASFMRMALDGIVYNFHWLLEVTLPDFTTLVNVLVPVAVLLPTLLTHGNSQVVDSVGLGAGGLGSLQSSSASANDKKPFFFGNAVFEWLFPVVTAIVAGAELMLREQDWTDIRVNVGVVYPEYYFIGTSAVVALTALLLCAGDAIGPACVWIVLCIQTSKLLHLIGMTSSSLLTTCMLVLAYTLPFVRVISKYTRTESENKAGFSTPRLGHHTPAATTIQPFEVFTYLLIATVATYYTYVHGIAHDMLEYVLSRDPTNLQQGMLCIGVWLAYVACVLVVFYRSAKLIRSLVLVFCGLCLLTSLEGFGHLNLTVQRTSTNFLTISFHPDMQVVEHPVLFFILTSVLSALAAIGMIPLNTLFMCVLYSALFAFISSKAMLAWAFPLSLADNTITHDVMAFPFVYLYVYKFLLTLVAVYNPALNPKQGRVVYNSTNLKAVSVTQGALVVACALPFFGLLYSISTNLYPIAHAGIEWSAIVSFVTLCVTTRIREVYNITTSNANTNSISSSYSSNISSSSATAYTQKVMTELSVCLPCAALAIFWMCFAVFTSHALDRDIFIPLSCLTLLCTTPGSVMKNMSPIVLTGLCCSVFWVLSAVYAVLVHNYNSDPALLAFVTTHDLFGLDSDVSIWTSSSIFWPCVHLFEILLPLPAVYVGVMPSFGQSEDVLFVFALCSVVPIFGAQISSLRYLGLVGSFFAAHKGYTMNNLRQQSDMLI